MKNLSPKQKASIALAALRREKISRLSSTYQVHQHQIGKWKKLAEEELEKLFADKRKKEKHSQERTIEELYKIIGQREVEIAWLKKNSNLNYREKLILVNKELENISCSSVYYEPIADLEETRIMNSIDEIFTKYPFYGHRRIKKDLWEDYEIRIGKKRTISLMKKMGLEAIYPKKKRYLSNPDQSHGKFPYLLSGLPIVKTNQVWGTDITYVKLLKGFAYLVAIIDWYSRYVVSWELSETLRIDFCLKNLNQALKINIPDIHNSDQGSHFTSPQYVDILKSKETIKISMDGRRRCMDNIFTERLEANREI